MIEHRSEYAGPAWAGALASRAAAQGEETAMAASRGLVLYGDSVFLAGLKAALSRYSALSPITIESGRHSISAQIQALNPRAIVFDLSAAHPEFVLGLLYERPDMLVIGVDASSDEILVLSLRKEHVSSIADLVNVIR
jgi:hypothetical protein